MKKNKKGFTLIEVIFGLIILGVALVIGAQTFSVAGTGYNNSAQLDHGVDYIFNAFENGTEDSELPENITKSTAKNVIVKVNVGGQNFVKNLSLTQVTFSYKNNNVRASLFGLSNSYGLSK